MSKLCRTTYGCGQMLTIDNFSTWGNRTSSCCKQCVRNRAKSLYDQKKEGAVRGKGLTKRNGFHKLTEEQINKCLQMLQDNNAIYAIAKYINKPSKTLYYWRDQGYLVPLPHSVVSE